MDAEGDWTGQFVLDQPPGDHLSFTSYHVLNIALFFLRLLVQRCGWPVDEGHRLSIAQKFVAIRPANYLTLARAK